MNGPDHYKEAERLLESARIDIDAAHHDGNRLEHDTQVARAQVHATLALTAATIEPLCLDYTGGEDTDNTRAWREVTK